MIIPLSLFACKIDLEDEFHIEKTPARNIQTPELLNVNTEYDISFDYLFTNGCYEFYEIEYGMPNDSLRIIIPFAKIQNAQNCTMALVEGTYTFRFKPTQPKKYIFKFWIGQNTTGLDQYEEYEFDVN